MPDATVCALMEYNRNSIFHEIYKEIGVVYEPNVCFTCPLIDLKVYKIHGIAIDTNKILLNSGHKSCPFACFHSIRRSHTFKDPTVDDVHLFLSLRTQFLNYIPCFG